MYRRVKAASAFIPGGTTQDDYEGFVQKRFLKDIEIRALVQYEGWKAPVYKPGTQSDTAVSFQVTWLPHDVHSGP